MSILESTVNNIDSLDKTSIEQAKKRLDRLIKPQGSLGKMEDICMQLAGIHKSKYFDTSKKVVIAFGADHGVYEEGVAPDPQSITYMQLPNFTKGICGVGVISKFVGADVVAVDIGVNCDHELEGVLNYKIRKGTSNMAKGPAMTREEAIRCLEIGIEMAEDSIKKGYNLIGIGEMGICNTTPSSAIISVIDNCDPEDVTGIGAGLKKERVKFKADTIRKSIELNKPNPEDAIDILSKVGGFEIGGMAGVILGCSANRIPVVLDGFISYAAALLAYKINQKTREYMIASHSSAETGTQRALNILNLEPVLNMGMRLGEGSGAALAFNIIEAANYTYENMATFDDIYTIINDISKEHKTVILDCVTLLVNNLMFTYEIDIDNSTQDEINELEKYIKEQVEKLLIEIKKTNLYFVIVTNELGLGGVSINKLTRIYTDIIGRINQQIATHSDEVYFVVSGIPMKIKG